MLLLFSLAFRLLLWGFDEDGMGGDVLLLSFVTVMYALVWKERR